MLTVSLLVLAAAAGPIEARVEQRLSTWRTTYEHLHRTPELSQRELETSKLVAARLRELGMEVVEGFGRYPDGSAARGVVGVLTNGKGPTVLLRTDLDALPVEEKTGLTYASRARAKDLDGSEVPVMHACGHDLHMTVFLGVAELLAGAKDQWRGKILFVGQPAEERGTGARALLEAGLYQRFGRPDFALAWHADAQLEAGKVGVAEGYALANVDTVDVTVRGAGGHGAYPHLTKDPVVLSAQLVLALQTLVSRQNSPFDPAVVTVGSIHGGSKHNVIPDEVHLQLTVRSYEPEVRKRLLDGIARTATGLAAAAGARAPTVTVSEDEFTPATYNAPDLVARVAGLWRERLSADRVVARAPVMGGEDFGRYRGDGQVQSALFWLGTVAPERYARREAEPLPSLHSSEFAPAVEPAVRTGVTAMTYAVLELLRR